MKGNLAKGRLFILTLLGTPLLAATLVVNPNPPTVAAGIRDQVTGADLTGLFVTATYGGVNGLFTSAASWATNGPTGSSATNGTGWTVSVVDNADAPFAWHYSSLFLDPLVSLERSRIQN